MLRLKHVVAFAVAAFTGALVACSTPINNECSAATCGGCCDAAGVCQAGDTVLNCGAAGNTCSSCSAGEVCTAAQCIPGGTGGGSGSTGGGTATTGGGTASTGGGTASTGGGTASTGGGTATTGGGTGTTGGGTATTGGGTGTTGGGSAMPFDAGLSEQDAGVTLSDGGYFSPPTVSIVFSPSCGTITPTAGDEAGDWYYSALCIDDAIFDAITNNSTLQANCSPVAVTQKQGVAAGNVSLSGGGVSITQNLVGRVYFHLSAGGLCAYSAACSQVPNYFPNYGLAGQCAVVSGKCECDITRNLNNSASGTYEYDGGVLTSGNDTYLSTIAEPTLSYRDVTDGGIPGVYELTRVGQ